MLFTVGIGFTVMEKVVGSPEQLFVKGTTVNWLVTGTKALVTTVNGLIFPVPVPLPIPMPILLAVQRYRLAQRIGTKYLTGNLIHPRRWLYGYGKAY